MELTVVIPAGGSGSRIGGTPKQYRLLGGSPVLVQTVRAISRWRDDLRFVVAAPAGDIALVAQMLDGVTDNCTVVSGGSTRQASVLAALRAPGSRDGVRPGSPAGQDNDLVLIHDSVRPFVDVDILDQLLSATIEHGAAAPAVPVTDTLRRAVDGFFGETVDRSELFRMQTPQVFRYREILEAHERAQREGWEATDDVELYSRFIEPVRLVSGSTANVKITSVEDLETAQRRWDRGQ